MHHGHHRKIRDVMTADPRTIEPTTPLVEAARLMRDEDVGPLPIVEGGRLVGMLTDRDIVVRAIADGRDPQSTTAGDVASQQVVTIDPEQDLGEALRLMAQHQVRRLPVVENGQLVGYLAIGDLAVDSGRDQLVGDALEKISEPSNPRTTEGGQ